MPGVWQSTFDVQSASRRRLFRQRDRLQIQNEYIAEFTQPRGDPYRRLLSYNIPLPAPVNEYEFDHLIPLGLGGSETKENMWPQAMHPAPGSREKDKVEEYLKKQVCSGNMTLAVAQKTNRD